MQKYMVMALLMMTSATGLAFTLGGSSAPSAPGIELILQDALDQKAQLEGKVKQLEQELKKIQESMVCNNQALAQRRDEVVHQVRELQEKNKRLYQEIYELEHTIRDLPSRKAELMRKQLQEEYKNENLLKKRNYDQREKDALKNKITTLEEYIRQHGQKKLEYQRLRQELHDHYVRGYGHSGLQDQYAYLYKVIDATNQDVDMIAASLQQIQQKNKELSSKLDLILWENEQLEQRLTKERSAVGQDVLTLYNFIKSNPDQAGKVIAQHQQLKQDILVYALQQQDGDVVQSITDYDTHQKVTVWQSYAPVWIISCSAALAGVLKVAGLVDYIQNYFASHGENYVNKK